MSEKKTLCFLYYENQLKLTLKFYPATGQTFYQTLEKAKTFSQPCNVVETYAILSCGFCKVLGPRLHKLLTLNGTVPHF